MVDLADFYPLIRIDVPDAPELLIKQHLQNTLIEFCRESMILHQDMAPITAVAGQRSYVADHPDDHKIFIMTGVRLDGVPVRPLFSGPNDFTLLTDPNAGQVITGKLGLYPSRSAAAVNDLLYEEYYEPIAAGVLSRLMAQPNKAWSNPGAVAYQRQVFENGMGDAKVRAMKGFSAEDQVQTHQPSFGVIA